MTGERPPLHTLLGAPAPPDVAEDLRRIMDLPPEARRRFWQALGPCLSDPISQGTERLLDELCRALGIADDDLARPIKACRFLLREAARCDLAADLFAADLEALHGGAAEISEILLAGYERAKAQIRQEILRGSLADHGRVLTGVDWRVDTMDASHRGAGLRAKVAILTFRYQEGDEARRITLQLTPDALSELKGVCERLLA
ncbi:MAG: hypothetical protein HUU18_10985 [Phycisphaerales bacterium]|nr:hypothetical protein [Polyangiaceae bacterium]NUQ68787.1 hypothetical protein [Phycisphaerales bacterium]